MINLNDVKKEWDVLALVGILLKGIKLHILFPLMGFGSIVVERKLKKETYFLLGLPLIGFALALFHKDMTSFARVAQLLGIVLAANFLIDRKINLLLFAKLTTAISIGVLVYDLIFVKPLIHHYFGQAIPRFKGIIREYNFSGAVYLTLFLIFERYKSKMGMAASIILILFTFSRGAMVTLAVFPIVKFILSKWPKLKYILLSGVILAPFLVFSINSFNVPLYKKLSKLSSYRFDIQKRSVQEVMKQPQGVGYFRGRAILLNVIKTEKPKFDATEPHNVFIQVMYEFGFVGFFLFCGYMFMLIRRAKYPTAVIISAILFSNLNGLHEVSFYLLAIPLAATGEDSLPS